MVSEAMLCGMFKGAGVPNMVGHVTFAKTSIAIGLDDLD
jgi:hypothetical protein